MSFQRKIRSRVRLMYFPVTFMPWLTVPMIALSLLFVNLYPPTSTLLYPKITAVIGSVVVCVVIPSILASHGARFYWYHGSHAQAAQFINADPMYNFVVYHRPEEKHELSFIRDALPDTQTVSMRVEVTEEDTEIWDFLARNTPYPEKLPVIVLSDRILIADRRKNVLFARECMRFRLSGIRKIHAAIRPRRPPAEVYTEARTFIDSL